MEADFVLRGSKALRLPFRSQLPGLRGRLETIPGNMVWKSVKERNVEVGGSVGEIPRFCLIIWIISNDGNNIEQRGANKR